MRPVRNSSYKKGLIFLIIFASALYTGLQVKTIYGGDAGDLASAIIVGGIPHPPGYPLYTILGIITTRLITFGTYAWRIGFLSSIPAIFTVLLLFDLINFLTRKIYAALISSLVLALIYPFWLYAVVVEVFSLNNLFLISLFWLLVHWSESGKLKYLYFGSIIFGLSLTHHHIILFLLPALFYLLIQKRQNLSRKVILISVCLFILGLLPYLYTFISAGRDNLAINWMGRPAISNFIALVTRARYGTFQSGGFTAHDPVSKFLNIWAFFDFVYKDFRLPGIIMMILGIYQLKKQNKVIFKAILLGLLAYLFFLFYASFPLVNNFLVATYERFILPLYILLIPILAFGFIKAEYLLTKYLGRVVNKRRIKVAAGLFSVTFLIYPVSLFILNFQRISTLKNDFSAEYLGRDILSSLPKNSILILSTDTPLFDTQYVYFAETFRPDVKVIHLTQFFIEEDLLRLKKIYPDLILPDLKQNSVEVFKPFLLNNYYKFPIYSKLVIGTNEGSWIPYGLVFRFVKKDEAIPSDESILAENKRLWDIYHIPASGSLAKFQNLMLSDLISIYAVAHQETGFWAVKRKYSAIGNKHLLEAERLYPQDLDSYIILAQSYIVDKRCKDAENQIEEVVKRNKDDVRINFLQSINYAVCFKDKEKSAFYQKLYEDKKSENDINLRKL